MPQPNPIVVAGLQTPAFSLPLLVVPLSSAPRPSREASRSPCHRTLPRNRRIFACARVCTSSRSPASTAARFVRFPELRIASRINPSSISMFVRIVKPLPATCLFLCVNLSHLCVPVKEHIGGGTTSPAAVGFRHREFSSLFPFLVSDF